MTDYDNYKSIEKSLRYLSGHVRQHGREILKEYDISNIQFIALQWINDKEGITIGQLANRLYLAYSTTTDIIDKLEEEKFVRRERGETDKRLVLVKIEAKGLRLIAKVIEKRVQYIETITTSISKEERMLLPQLLETILEESERLRHEEK